MISESVPKPGPRIGGQDILSRRMEFKYLVDRTTRTGLTRDLLAFMWRDPYAGPDGCYYVRSLYFDTPNYRAYHDKLAGLPSRHKLRVRAYGADPSRTSCVRLEVKSRYLAFIRKIVVDMPRDEYADVERSFHTRSLPPARFLSAAGVSQEFFRIQKQFNMQPKVIVQYRREAFERKELGRIRVNFDDHLVGSTELDLLGRLPAAHRLMNYGRAVFEIKVDGGMPAWLHTLIAKYNLQDQAFSKYCNAVRGTARMSALGREF